MNKYRDVERKHLPQIEAILNMVNSKKGVEAILLNESTEMEDTKLSFDAITSIGTKVSIRIRKLKYFDRFKDVTIRRVSMNGGKTELDKLKDGLGEMYFFAWADDEGIKHFIYYSIDKLRPYLDYGTDENNPDGTGLRCFSFKKLLSYNAVDSCTSSLYH